MDEEEDTSQTVIAPINPIFADIQSGSSIPE